MNPPATHASGAHERESVAYLVTVVRDYPAMSVIKNRTPLIQSGLYRCSLNAMGNNTLQLVEQSLSSSMVSCSIMLEKRQPVQAEAFRRLLPNAVKGEACIDIYEPDLLSQEWSR